MSTDDPLLGPLAANGGPTWTHALIDNSPAVDQGVDPLNLGMDQRGPSFARISGGAPDVGAFERQVTGGPALVGDYNGNLHVDAADYVVWRRAHGTLVAPFSGADGNGDGKVDDADYGLWRANFGKVVALAAADVAAQDVVLTKPRVEIELAPAAPPAQAESTAEQLLSPIIHARRPDRVSTLSKNRGTLAAFETDPLELALISMLKAADRPAEAIAARSDKTEPQNGGPDAVGIDQLWAEWPAAF